MRRLLVTTLLPALASLLPLAAHAADGEQWEYTSQFEMEEMKMPATTTKVCVKPGTPPRAQIAGGEGCVFKSSGGSNGGPFTFKCPPPNAMEGQGEMRFTTDTARITIKAKSDGEVLTIQQTGRKVGRCNNAN